MHRRLLTAALAVTALAAPAGALADTRPHPAFTDPVGDAFRSTFLRPYTAAADLVAGDVTTDGTTLRFTTQLAGARRALAPTTAFTIGFSADGGGVYSEASDTSSRATLVVATGDGDTIYGISVAGTTTFDARTNTLTSSYSLAEVNAAEDRLREDPAYYGGARPITITPDSIVTNVGATSRVGNDTGVADRADSGPVSFRLGG